MIIATVVYAISIKIDLSSKIIEIIVVVVITSIIIFFSTITFISTITSKFNFYIDSQLESILSNDIIVYDSSTNAVKLVAIVNEFFQI